MLLSYARDVLCGGSRAASAIARAAAAKRYDYQYVQSLHGGGAARYIYAISLMLIRAYITTYDMLIIYTLMLPLSYIIILRAILHA